MNHKSVFVFLDSVNHYEEYGSKQLDTLVKAAVVSQSAPSSVSLVWKTTGPRSSLNPVVFLTEKKGLEGMVVDINLVLCLI